MRRPIQIILFILGMIHAPVVKSSDLPPCPEDGSPYQNCFNRVSKPDSVKGPRWTYEGEWWNSKMEGQGNLINHDTGTSYTGQFMKGSPHGWGTLTWKSGDMYVGEVKNGRKHGWGTWYVRSGKWKGAKVEGEFVNGVIHGWARSTAFNGGIQEGYWSNGSFLRRDTYPVPVPIMLRQQESRLKIKGRQRKETRLRRERQIISEQRPENPPPKKRSFPKSGSTGSGFFVSKLGHIITNEHVVRDCSSTMVGDKSKNLESASVLEKDKRNDLALLRISSTKITSSATRSLINKLSVQTLGVKVVPLASEGLVRSNDGELGEDVLVAGYPYGELFSDTIKVTKGIVSADRGAGNNSGQFQIGWPPLSGPV